VGAKLCFVEPGRRWAHSPSPSKAPGYLAGYYENLREDVKNLRRSLTVIWKWSGGTLNLCSLTEMEWIFSKPRNPHGVTVKCYFVHQSIMDECVERKSVKCSSDALIDDSSRMMGS